MNILLSSMTVHVTMDMIWSGGLPHRHAKPQAQASVIDRHFSANYMSPFYSEVAPADSDSFGNFVTLPVYITVCYCTITAEGFHIANISFLPLFPDQGLRALSPSLSNIYIYTHMHVYIYIYITSMIYIYIYIYINKYINKLINQ